MDTVLTTGVLLSKGYFFQHILSVLINIYKIEQYPVKCQKKYIYRVLKSESCFLGKK